MALGTLEIYYRRGLSSESCGCFEVLILKMGYSSGEALHYLFIARVGLN